jgi:hypothetical protein
MWNTSFLTLAVGSTEIEKRLLSAVVCFCNVLLLLSGTHDSGARQQRRFDETSGS